MPDLPTTIDLFSGAGGLTVGLKSAGFEVVAAVENDPSACKSYKSNHPEVTLLEADIREVRGESFAKHLNGRRLDLLTGCPPCQGFTSLTSKYKRSDLRNALIREFGRLVDDLNPRLVMLENVPRLGVVGKELLGEFLELLSSRKYNFDMGTLDAADFGVPQFRKRFVLIASKIGEIQLPKPTHASKKLGGLKPHKTVKSALKVKRKAITLSEARGSNSRELSPSRLHIVRDISELNRQRLAAASPGETWVNIPEHLRPPCHQNGYRGFMNTYGRLEWDAPSPTITSGCITPSKGRFGHPEEIRTISIREAALLQSFPSRYRFIGNTIDDICQMIGNALPPVFATALAENCRQHLP